MAGPFSDIERSIFVSKEVLSEDHQPDQILERDEEIDQYRHALQDVLFGRTPQNVMLYGKAGLGKTAVTTYMMEALQDEVTKRPDADDVHVHELNCNGKSLYTVVRTLVNGLLPEHASEFPKRGLGTADAFEELYTQLDRIGGTHLVVFDEIDHWTMSTPSCMNSRERDRSVTSRTRRSESSESVTTTRFGSRSRRR